MQAFLYHIGTGDSVELESVAMVGRSPECQLHVPDSRVSRRHAMIRKQDGGYYLFDLGSFNGSYLNGTRVSAARKLNPGDLVEFAGHEFRYEQAGSWGSSLGSAVDEGETIGMIRSTPVVILVSDVVGFTRLSEQIKADSLAQIIGSWYSDCERIIASQGGSVDKFIGDSVLAYWTKVDEDSLAAALRTAQLQQVSCQRIEEEHSDLFSKAKSGFEIGVGIHTGAVAYGGMSQSETTLMGDPVNLTFRLEALTRKLEYPVLLSGEFVEACPEARRFATELGVHPVKGRSKEVEVFGVRDFPAR